MGEIDQDSETFYRELRFGELSVVIRLRGKVHSRNGDNYFFGFPLHPALASIGNGTIREAVNAIKGHFLYVGIDADRVIVANDIAAGFRTYTAWIDRKLHISDDHLYLAELMRQQAPLQLDENEYHYWTKHSYTTGGATFVKDLRKLEPATIAEITSGGLNTDCYFHDLESTPDPAKHSESCFDDVSETMRWVAGLDAEIVLNFSGGVDSTLLALLLRELRKDFTLVFAKSVPFYDNNYVDCIKARQVAKYLGLQLREIETGVDCAPDKLTNIVRNLIFDRHPSAYQYFESMEQVCRTYGAKTAAINGQGADSVLTFGPSGKRRADYFARLLKNFPGGIPSRLAGEIVRNLKDRTCRVPRSPLEFLSAFLDDYGYYYPLLSRRDSENYRNYIKTVASGATERFKHFNTKVMYLEIYGLLQGTDSRVMLKSAQAAGIESVVMPYKSPSFIYNTIRYKSKTRDLFNPKYVVRRGIKRLGVKLPLVHVPPDKSVLDQATLTRHIRDLYFSESLRLIAGG